MRGIPLRLLWLVLALSSVMEAQRRREGPSEGGGGGRRGMGRDREIRPLIRPQQEIVNAVDSGPQNFTDTNYLSIETARHSEIAEGSLGTGDSDMARHQMDTIILLLQRLSDRLASLETIQNQRGERLDTVHYRLTKLELQAEERKSIINDLSNSLRHRMEITDSERDRIGESLDELQTNVMSLKLQNVEVKRAVDELNTRESGIGSSGTPKKLQAAVTSIYGLRSMTQSLRQDISDMANNMTALSSISSQVSQLREGMVTKQYLHQNLNEIRAQQMAQSVPVLQPRTRKGQTNKEPEDCWKLLQKGKKRSGVYRIQPQYSTVPFFVYCDMETDGGGWTVIQRREDGSVDFLREWADYKHGFGNLAGEFWLGNEKIHLITNQHVSKLRIDLADFDQQEGRAQYSAFAMGSELEGYSLKMLGQYTGDAGDSLRYHVGRRFSTIDVDNDAWPEDSCARDHKGAWWYKACETSNLNGRYLHGPIPAVHEYSGLYWYDFRGPQYSLWRSRMMIRRGGNVGQPIFKDFREVQENIATPGSYINETEVPEPTERPDPRGHFDEDFINPEHDPYADYDYYG